MNKEGFILLSEEELLKKYFVSCRNYIRNALVTDYAVLLGTCSNDGKFDNKGFWWLRDFNNNSNTASCINYNGNLTHAFSFSSACGIRPVINYSLIEPFCEGEYDYYEKYKFVIFGEYPNSVASDVVAGELEKKYINNTLEKCSDSCTSLKFDASKYSINNNQVYVYQYQKYVRVVPNADIHGHLHDGSKIVQGKPYWLRVLPVQWIVDKEKNVAISANIIIGGIPFLARENTMDFEHSLIKQYLDMYFTKEIVSNDKNYKNSFLESIEEGKKEEKVYNLSLDIVSEEDIIRGSIESDVPVFIHGRSSDGKSARVKEIDPDCEIIYMRNATPDSLNGKSVFDSNMGKMIDVPPTWYKKVVEKCSSEPDKIHIVFFDELTNALPSMQGMAFNIILDKEVNGKWKLPKNARIVAAGNDLGDSLAANKMAEPLFNRFAHVYIKTGVEDWLKWAVEDKDDYQKLDYEEFESEEIIHPLIISYIEEKYKDGVNVLRTPYDGERPNADPRKWEMASKILYKTKKLKMLRALVGESITNDFAEYIKIKSDENISLKTSIDDMNDKLLKNGKSF